MKSMLAIFAAALLLSAGCGAGCSKAKPERRRSLIECSKLADEKGLHARSAGNSARSASAARAKPACLLAVTAFRLNVRLARRDAGERDRGETCLKSARSSREREPRKRHAASSQRTI